MKSSFFQIALLGGLAAGVVAAVRKLNEYRVLAEASGSTTNASDAVDDIRLRPGASAEEVLDAGVQETFPASDPVSVNGQGETAYEKEQRRRRAGA